MAWCRKAGREKEERLLDLWLTVKRAESYARPSLHGGVVCMLISCVGMGANTLGVNGGYVLSLSFLMAALTALAFWFAVRAAVTDPLWDFVDEVYMEAHCGGIDMCRLPGDLPEGMADQIKLISERAGVCDEVRVPFWDFKAH